MPYALTFDLDAEQVATLPAHPGRALHALFYNWLAVGDYARSIEVHREEGPRPFTIALVRRRGVPVLRVTLLDDTLWAPLQVGLAASDEVEVAGTKLTLPSDDGRQVVSESYEELASSAGTATRCRFQFLSPTSFRSRDMHYPLPDPVLAFQSWLNRWNLYVPETLQINVAVLDVVAAHVAVSRYRGGTELVDWGAGKRVVGFKGWVEYLVLRGDRLGVAWLRRLNTLADFAGFCGTGHKTAQGLGQTVRVG